MLKVNLNEFNLQNFICKSYLCEHLKSAQKLGVGEIYVSTITASLLCRKAMTTKLAKYILTCALLGSLSVPSKNCSLKAIREIVEEHRILQIAHSIRL